MNIAIITGASSGIGREFVRQIAEDSSLSEIWIIARRADKLDELVQECRMQNAECRIKEQELKIVPIAADITKKEDIEKIKSKLENPQFNILHSAFCIKYLVNSAGYGKLGLFKDADIEESAGMVDLNCTALTKLTGIVLPYMAKGSRIINIASAAAFMPQPKFAVYAATKAYVLSFSRALRAELKKQKIKVTAVCPGPVRTEFFDAAGTGMAKIKKLFMADPVKVVRGSLRASRRNKAVYTHKFSMKSFRLLAKIIPKSWLMGFIG